MATIRRSLLLSTSQRAIQALLTILGYMVLARLLTPEDIGLFSIAGATISVAQVVREFGVGGYLIQERDLTETRIRTAFTVSLAMGVSLAGIVLLAAGPVSTFYNDGRLRALISVLSINFLMIPFGSIGMTLLRREMQFGHIFWITSVATAVGLVISITLASKGYGYWALAYSSIANTGCTTVLTALISRGRLAYTLTLKEWRRVTSFGSRATAVAIITQFSTDMNDLVVGKAISVSAVSIISRAQGVINIFQRDFLIAIRSVASPAFAKAGREGDDLERLHTKSIAYITALAWPFYGFIALFPLELLRLIFGPQWDTAAPLIPILCLAAAISAPCSMILTLLIASGRVDLALRADLLAQPFKIVLLFVCALVYPTLLGFAFVYLVSNIWTALVLFWIKGVAVPTHFREMALALAKNVLIAVITLIGPVAVALSTAHIQNTTSMLVTVLGAGTLAFAGWVTSLRLVRSPLYEDPFVVSLRKHLGRILA